MRNFQLLALAVAGGLAMASDPAFAATAISAQINANASAALVTSLAGLPGVTDTHGHALAGLPDGDLGIGLPAAFVSINNGEGGHNSVEASTGISGSWDSANQGRIGVSSNWDVSVFDPTLGLVVQATTIDQTLSHTAPAWQYAFQATGNDDLFSMDFDIQLFGDAFGRGAWDLNVTQDGQQLGFHTLSNGAASGNFTQALLSGHDYVFTLTSNDGITLFPDGRHTSHFQVDEESLFNWSITGRDPAGVPEPSTWALTIVGFGLAGAALRRAPRSRLA